MQGGEIHAVQLVFLVLLLFVVIFAALARKLDIPYPIVLVVAGLVLSFIPGTPRIRLNPDVIFLVVLPPLLYSAAWVTSWREFKGNLVSILFLAFGLVGFTVLGVAGAAYWLFGSGRETPGAGSARRLTFPFGLTGSVSRVTKAAGTM